MPEKKRTFIEIASDIAFTKDSFEMTEQEIDERMDELYMEMRKKKMEFISFTRV